jgi:hypothetical protein
MIGDQSIENAPPRASVRVIATIPDPEVTG